MNEREAILVALSAFVAQRPGIEPMNYGSWSDYRAESRSVTQDAHDFATILAAVRWRTGIDADALREAFRGSRCRLVDGPKGTLQIDYCTGQYFPTEYRKGACRVLAAALWKYTREACNANVDDRRYGSLGEEIRATFKREFGARIARRYFV